MISPLLDPSRKPPNALRGLRRKMAHFIPNAGVHTKGSYNSTTTAFCAPSKKDGLRGGCSPNPVAVGSAVRGRLLRLAATIGGRAFAAESLEVLRRQTSDVSGLNGC